MRSLLIFLAVVAAFIFGLYHFYASGKLQQFLDKHPNQTWGVRTQYYLTQLYVIKSEYSKAIDSADRILKLYPKTKFAENALYMKAKSLEFNNQKQEAADAYKLFIETYPNSSSAEFADRRNKKLLGY
jgi:TolA-binding protein